MVEWWVGGALGTGMATCMHFVRTEPAARQKRRTLSDGRRRGDRNGGSFRVGCLGSEIVRLGESGGRVLAGGARMEALTFRVTDAFGL